MTTPAVPSLLPFTIFALAGALTPGPNNSIAMMTGANSGLRAVLPHLLGVPTGFAAMTALSGAGFGAVLAAAPAWNFALQCLGALYLLYLSWRLGSSPVAGSGPLAGSDDGAGADAGATRGFRRLNFLQSVLFQFSNPKAWAFSLATVTAFAAQSAARLAAMIAIWSLAIVVAVALWAALGHALKGLMDSPLRRRAFNVGAALLLAATAVASVLPQLSGLAASMYRK